MKCEQASCWFNEPAIETETPSACSTIAGRSIKWDVAYYKCNAIAEYAITRLIIFRLLYIFFSYSYTHISSVNVNVFKNMV